MPAAYGCPEDKGKTELHPQLEKISELQNVSHRHSLSPDKEVFMMRWGPSFASQWGQGSPFLSILNISALTCSLNKEEKLDARSTIKQKKEMEGNQF